MFTKVFLTMLNGITADGVALLTKSKADMKTFLGVPADIPIITPWVSYVPTFQGWTPDQVNIFSRRVGDTLQLRGRFRSASPVATEARLTLGFNGASGSLTIDAAKNPTTFIAGEWRSTDNSLPNGPVIAFGGVGYLAFSINTAIFTAQNGSGVLVATQTMGIRADVPISGWS
ncbi:hypothetical protein HF272_13785 [Rhizobium leguminosarum]|uniref:hypothetical protein n=1 Tax=Rhizobium leguminosarum TaxID=384 RepID=UPI001C91EB28|nr:hypothetical protein [Rhizobium leguminosarum]MBY2992501.1 hypothetical protein [Rhizobium leguminosarum]